MRIFIKSSLILACLATTPFLSGCYVGPGYGYHGGYYDGHHDWHHGWAVTVADQAVPSTSPTALSQQFGIQQKSADAIVQFAAKTDSKDLQGAASTMGVTLEEMAPLASLNMPTPETLQKVADKLGEDRSKIQSVFEGYIADVSAERLGASIQK